MAAIKGEKTLAELAQQFDVHPNQIMTWRGQLLEGAAGVFGAGPSEISAAPPVDLKVLHAKIGPLALAKHGRPEIFNTDQGSQFTSAAFTGLLRDNGIAISMDGRGGVARQRLCRTAMAVSQI